MAAFFEYAIYASTNLSSSIRTEFRFLKYPTLLRPSFLPDSNRLKELSDCLQFVVAELVHRVLFH